MIHAHLSFDIDLEDEPEYSASEIASKLAQEAYNLGAVEVSVDIESEPQ